MQPDAIYRGQVRHRRFHPKPHQFHSPLVMLQLDLAHLSAHFERSRWWSLEGFNLISFMRRDYLDAPGANLDEAVRDLVAQKTGKRPAGAVQIYTQPRFWGLVFNPVSFYWCHDADGKLETIIAEINSTPWNERHAYVLPISDNLSTKPNTFCFEFDKSFHVSPFMPMTLRYRWQFSFRGSRNVIHMTLLDGERCHFDATFVASASPLSKQAMARLPWRYAAQCVRVVTGIYWHALVLWLKRTPFYSHPQTEAQQNSGRHP